MGGLTPTEDLLAPWRLANPVMLTTGLQKTGTTLAGAVTDEGSLRMLLLISSCHSNGTLLTPPSKQYITLRARAIVDHHNSYVCNAHRLGRM